MDEKAKMDVHPEDVLGDCASSDLLLATNVSVSYFVYFFYFAGVLYVLTKVLEFCIQRRMTQLAKEE